MSASSTPPVRKSPAAKAPSEGGASGHLHANDTQQTIRVACSNCNLRELCLPVGLTSEQMERVDDVVAVRRKIKRGGSLFRN
ncbi:MAG: hypothetical protein ACTS8S_11440, partial [Giesbergeria sp.]